MAYYRTGQAAKALGVSDHHVRRLCESGLIEAELTERNHWRIPTSEIERLTEHGVPELPARTSERSHSIELAAMPTSPITVDAGSLEDPAIRKARSTLVITRTRLEQRKVQLETEQLNDAFRERTRRRKEEREAEVQRQRDLDAAEARRSRDVVDTALRKEWSERHIARALNSLPWNSTGEIRLGVAREVQVILNTRRHDDDDTVTIRLTDAATHKALFPMRRFEIQNDAQRRLPIVLRNEAYWSERAHAAASLVLRNVRDTATDIEMRTMVEQALRPIVVAAEHEQKIRNAISQLCFWMFLKAQPDERERAGQAVRRELARLPVDSSPMEFSRAIANALAPLEDEVEERHAREQNRSQAETLAARAEGLLLEHLDEFFE